MLDTLLLIPHGHCYLWKPNLVGLHVVSDALIGIAYYSIPLTLLYFVQKRKDVPFDWIFLLFSAFIAFCGTTHLMSIWTLWHPAYWVSGTIKALTAAISVYTAIQLIPIVPKALDLPSPAQLEAINHQLQQHVAKREQAERHLRQLSARLNLAVKSAAIGIWDWDMTQDILTWDKRMYELYGLIPECFTPAYGAWSSCLHPDDRRAAEMAAQQALQGEKDFDQDFRVVHPDGSIHYIKANALVQRDPHGDPQRMIGVSYDITDRKQAEQQLQQLNQALEAKVEERTRELQALARREQLSANIATQIRSSLDLQVILETAVREIRSLLQCARVNIWRFDADGQTMVVAESTDSSLSLVGERVNDTCLQDYTALYRQGRVRIVPDIYTTDMSACHRELLIRSQIRAKILVPLLCGDELWGLLHVSESQHPRDWQPEEVELLQALSVQLGIALQQATIHQQLQAELNERQQTEARLRASEQRYITLAAAVPVGIYRTDAAGNCLYVNDRLGQITGLAPEATMGQGWRQGLHPDDRDRVVTEWYQSAQENRPFQLEYRFQHPDGTVRWVYGQSVAEWDADGQVIGYVGTITDISERKRLEAERKQVEAERLQAKQTRKELTLLEQILDIILAGYWDWDIPGNQEYLSLGFKQMFGYADHELPNTPETWQNLIFPQDLPGVLECFNRHVQSRGEVPYVNEVRYRHKDGSTVWVICSSKVIEWDEAGNPLRMIGCHIDISDRKRAEAALISSEARLQYLVSSSPVVIFSCKPNGDYGATFISENVEALLGWNAQDFLADSEFWLNHLHPDDAERVLAGLANLFTGDFYAHEYRLRKGDDTYCWCLAQLRLIRDQAGNPLEMLGYLIDISDRKHTEAALRDSEARLQLITDSIPGCISYTDASQHYRFVNHTYEEWFGCRKEDILERSIAEVLGAEAYQRARQHIERVLSGETVTYENELPYQGRQPRYVSGKLVPEIDSQGRVHGYYALITDISDLKQAEAALKASRAYYQGIVSDQTELICRFLPDGILTFVNDAYCQFFQKSPEDLLGRSFTPLIPAEDKEIALQTFNSLSVDNPVVTCEHRVIAPDGSIRWQQWTDRALVDPDGNFIEFQAVGRDITALKEAEADIKRHLTAIEAAIDGISILRDGHYSYLNQSQLTLFGYSQAEDLLGQSWQVLYPAQEVRRFQKEVLPQVKQHGFWHGEATGKRRDNTLFPVEVSLTLTPTGDIIRVCRDISDRKQAEDHLRQMSVRLNLAVKSAAMGIWDWDVTHNILTWDQQMYELYGITPEQFTNVYEAWSSSVHPDDLAAAETAVQQALRGEKDFDQDFRVIHPDGTIRFIKANALVQRNRHGDPEWMIGINYDITARKRTEAQIQEYATQLESSNRELEAFAYSVSHDLRAPLRAIDGFSKALLEDYGDTFDEEGQDYFDRIRKNVTRMGMLIDDLLSLSRVSRYEIRHTTVNLSTLAQELMAELQASEPERPVEVGIAPDAIVSADATLMRVVLTNLLQNAWKFTSHHPTARIEFGMIYPDGQPVYFVRDDGAGFDMAYSNMLFGVFQRLHNIHEFPGTGIGLATVQRAIHRHGGRVWAEATVEQGATFYFTLPSTPLELGA
ncbi:multi-sensor signal transduction histidine kinase [Halomicronema hongdechloris C2206]|uniref:histidine kinase n=1 Tax=Halomicronema hongdechloris C2206 TaxID=1641165 RepID=A0A1Z3HTU8_9CYAN|nr:PAS domain-containing protein [Halomicronema hongdechloris]ASC73740.1 multi-sensor signal transduction histidine kinase [Halomicronema hongdechloris C2206]